MFSNRRINLILVALVSIALVAFALYLQHVLKQKPCPLCIVQRMAFLLLAAFALFSAMFPPGHAAQRALTMLGVLFGAGGIAAAIKQLFFTATDGGCGRDIIAEWVNHSPLADHWPEVFFANGTCMDAYPPILGLSVPVWSLLWLSALSVALILLSRAQKRKGWR